MAWSADAVAAGRLAACAAEPESPFPPVTAADAVFWADCGPLVRPFVIAHERELERQRAAREAVAW
ncbi:hypothetical protein RKE29_16025 [Streptomyces sp. B1866]|uniref:hypothetical protein n=1 Tax=Streptomyces sp. B1866 TaxID=3075431 RepID=UPI0028907CEF|nr:hypothetical protein [Streptomyces sp. B1866]MDT3398131.1 hypothetical protein [Streptomyces sp. B1866]